MTTLVQEPRFNFGIEYAPTDAQPVSPINGISTFEVIQGDAVTDDDISGMIDMLDQLETQFKASPAGLMTSVNTLLSGNLEQAKTEAMASWAAPFGRTQRAFGIIVRVIIMIIVAIIIILITPKKANQS
jgi:hypothetical protein